MIRFVDLGKQLAVYEDDSDYPREFCFYNTLGSNFMDFNGSQAFRSWDDLTSQFVDEEFPKGTLERLRSLCAQWVFGEQK
jgi:hypothetical protein